MATDAHPGTPGRAAAYLAIVGTRFRVLLQYRVAALAGFGTQLFWGAIKLMALAAFLRASGGESPMSFAQIAAYIWLAQALLGLLPWNIDPEIGARIRSGDVAYELLRPLDLYGFWYMRTLAYRTAGTLLRAIPMVLFAMGVMPHVGLAEWSLRPPPDGAAALAFVASLLAMVLLASAVTMLMHIALLWTVSGEGVNRMMPGIVPLFSGLTVPLPLFPDWAQPWLYWQPLRGLVDVPFRLYSGHIPAVDAPFEVALQLAWALVLVLLGRALLARGQRRLVVQGG